MTTKGITLEQGQVVVLALDGSLVYVESVQTAYAEVVALPEQLATRTEGPVFTPGRVGAKKISPFSKADRVVPVTDLTERNKTFIMSFEKLRAEFGPNHIDRTPEELAAFQAANAPKPDKATLKLQRDEAREKAKTGRQAEKAAKKAAKAGASGPRYLQRCAVCGEQPGNPTKHGTADQIAADPALHEFVAPAAPTVEPEQPKAVKAPRTPRASGKSSLAGSFRWIGDDDKLKLLAAGNPKYKDGNSGGAIVAEIRDAGDDGISIAGIVQAFTAHDKWSSVPEERIEFAFKQLLNGGLLEAVS